MVDATRAKEERGKVYIEQGKLKKDDLPVVSRDFLKKYISYAKAQKAPEL